MQVSADFGTKGDTVYERSIVDLLASRLQEPRRFIQIVIGPRQTGKSTAVAQALDRIAAPTIEHSFDLPRDRRPARLEAAWNKARESASAKKEIILSLDEIQKVPDWSSIVKYLWDEDTRLSHNIKVVLTGSSALTLQSGMAESLKGRFEEIPSTQWTYRECSEAFGYSLDDFLFFGGYPGASSLKDDLDRWFAYMRASIIEPTLTQDVLEMEQIRKPALLRALFEVGAVYSAQEISYRKLLGQLDDRGNTETISHYLSLISHAGLLSGLKKYDDKIPKTRSSSPRLMVHDTSLMTAATENDWASLIEDPAQRGHLVESAVGAYLIGRSKVDRFSVHWWRERDHEVDFVICKGKRRTAIEVKSGHIRPTKGLNQFISKFPGTYALIIGSDECPLEEFLLGNVPLFQ